MPLDRASKAEHQLCDAYLCARYQSFRDCFAQAIFERVALCLVVRANHDLREGRGRKLGRHGQIKARRPSPAPLRRARSPSWKRVSGAACFRLTSSFLSMRSPTSAPQRWPAIVDRQSNHETGYRQDTDHYVFVTLNADRANSDARQKITCTFGIGGSPPSPSLAARTVSAP